MQSCYHTTRLARKQRHANSTRPSHKPKSQIPENLRAIPSRRGPRTACPASVGPPPGLPSICGSRDRGWWLAWLALGKAGWPAAPSSCLVAVRVRLVLVVLGGLELRGVSRSVVAVGACVAAIAVLVVSRWCSTPSSPYPLLPRSADGMLRLLSIPRRSVALRRSAILGRGFGACDAMSWGWGC